MRGNFSAPCVWRNAFTAGFLHKSQRLLREIVALEFYAARFELVQESGELRGNRINGRAANARRATHRRIIDLDRFHRERVRLRTWQSGKVSAPKKSVLVLRMEFIEAAKDV